MPAITPCLWFDDNLEEAAAFYTQIFPNASIGSMTRMPDGTVVSGDFDLDGQTFRGINGGPIFAGFTETISFSIACQDQSEVDYYWDSLVAGGEPSQCAWLKDKFGLSWQIVPVQLPQLLGDPDPARAQAAMQAMMEMSKIVIADLEAAADAVTTSPA